MRHLQFAKIFQINQLRHLQHFVSISRLGMQVRLELTKLPLTLRSIIGNRSIMQERGKGIIILLIKALTELEQANVTHRSINPNNIQLPQDLSNIVLADLSNMVDAGGEVDYEQGAEAPYCSMGFMEHRHLEKSDAHWDTWSVGVIILEILMGTEFVLLANNHQKLLSALQMSAEYLDRALYELLEEMLLDGYFGKATAFVEEHEHGEGDIIAENIRRMDAETREDYELQERVKAFHFQMNQASDNIVRDLGFS